jgi:hypothetical protein
LVRALKPWFSSADPDCDYLFTSGINFEITALYDKKPEEPAVSDDTTDAADGAPPRHIVQVVMPGGALGAAFHVPLVAHEAGHVLHDRFKKADFSRMVAALSDRLKSIEDIPAPDSSTTSREIFLSWVEEVFADTYCGFVSGPAGFFALHEKLRLDAAPNKMYPHNDIRVASLRNYIERRFGEIFRGRNIKSNEWADWPVLTEEELLEQAGQYPDYAALSRQFILAITTIREISDTVARELMGDL